MWVFLLILVSFIVVGADSWHANSLLAMRNGIRKMANRMQSVKITTTDDISIGRIKDEIENGPIPKRSREFRVNGWRWHTQSVLRDLDRFEKVIEYERNVNIRQLSNKKGTISNLNPLNDQNSKSNIDLTKRLMLCYTYVCQFNWRALMRVERDIFYPWLRDILPEQSRALAIEFTQSPARARTLMDRLKRECEGVQRENPATFNAALATLDELRSCAKRSQKLQENVFVPFITAHITVRDQERFNRQVIKTLGMLESQVHLVGMREAISKQPTEEKIFKQQIPRLVQSMIPVWRNAVYKKKTMCLELPNSASVNDNVLL